jgi:hypothetical protein
MSSSAWRTGPRELRCTPSWRPSRISDSLLCLCADMAGSDGDPDPGGGGR